MSFDLSNPSQLMAALGPDLLLAGGAMILLLWAAWHPESDVHQRRVGVGAIVLCLLTIALTIAYMAQDFTASHGPIAVDDFRWMSDLIFLLATVLAIALAMDYNRRENLVVSESHVLMLLATSGMMLLAAARDLTLVFLGIELMSLSTYVLAGFNRRSRFAAEAALKYFLLGAFSTAFLLYGIALIYGGTGSTNIAAIGDSLRGTGIVDNPMLTIGIALLLVGFAFKVAAVPFHMWAPDVYEGAPTPVTAYMAAAVKAAAFAVFLRVWIEAFQSAAQQWHLAVWWLAVVTMVVANLIALAQRNIKRLLAYSSIAHAGYLLMAVVVSSATGASAFMFYLVAYTFATMGAFAVVVALAQAGERNLLVEDYAGLWNVRPGLALAMAVFMLALLGFPIVGGMGFFAKWYVLEAALQGPAPQTRLAVALVLTSVLSAGYYLYVVMVMFMRPRAADAPAIGQVPGLTRAVIVGAVLVLLVFGLYPEPLVRLTRESAPDAAGERSGAPPAVTVMPVR